MRIQCEYCSGYIDDTDEVCEHCGAANLKLKRQANGVPRTIVELDQWYKAHNLPPKEVTRFFIGEDYKGAKAYGIYKDGNSGNVIVYKNKADGSRAVRYEGKDEAYAVNELYQKLKEQIQQQKAQNAARRSSGASGAPRRRKKKRVNIVNIIVWSVIILAILFMIWDAATTPSEGYYSYKGDQYYYQGTTWYIYDNDSWTSTYVDDELYDEYDDYYESRSFDSSYGTSDFSDTSYYESYNKGSSSSSYDSDSSWSSDWDSDSSWDSGDSWSDSGGWDSDW